MRGLDAYITGNYGEDQFDWTEEDEETADIAPRIVGSFDNMEFDRNMPLTFTTVPATDEADDEPTETDNAADYSWTHDRS